MLSHNIVELNNFPMISQRDGDPNQDFDCVPASIAACVTWLTGKGYTARQIKDAVYGVNYQGGTGAQAYVSYCREQGVTLAPMDGNGSQLVADLRAQIAAGHPCLITEPDPYLAGWTHVCAAYKDDGSNIVVMDPWIDQPIAKSYGNWTAQLQDNEIWVLELENTMITIKDPFAAAYFKQIASGPDRWHCASTGFDLFAGILAGWCKMNGAPRLPIGPEVPCGKQAVYQKCESGVMLYDPGHELDSPHGPWEPCYLLKLDSPLAQKLLTPAPVSASPSPKDHAFDEIAAIVKTVAAN